MILSGHKLRLGVSAPGDRVLGHLHVSSVQLAAVPSAHAPQLGCGVGVPVAPLSDNARSSKWQCTQIM